MLVPAESIVHLLEKAHLYYGVPHMFHEVWHWALTLLVGRYGSKWRLLKVLHKGKHVKGSH